jgi:hypothetical protein
MSRRIEHRAEYGHPLEKVLHALTDPDAIRERLAEIGGHNAELLSHEKSEGQVRYEMQQGVPARKLPSAVSSILGGDLVVRREQVWDTNAASAATGSATAAVSGVPGSIKATSELKPTGDGCALRVTGEVKVGIPLVGGKIEQTIADQVVKLLDYEADYIEGWLARG